MKHHGIDVDVVVVGGGPAGLAAAIAARRQGLSVIVADSATPPIDKACGEGLMPDAQIALAGLGLEISSRAIGIFKGIKFIGPEGAAVARFPRGEGIGIRRTLLHGILLEHAARLGAQALWGASVHGLEDGGVRIGKDVIRARWLIGADGQHSRVRKWAGLAAAREAAPRIGIRKHFNVEPLSDFVEIYWGEGRQAYVTPIGPREVCVALISRKRLPSFAAGLSLFPQLARHLAKADHTTSVRGATSTSRKLNSVVSGHIALIGEASGSVDAITGEGLALAFRQATALGRALAAGDLSLYQAAHSEICTLPSFMAQSMLLMDKSSWIRRQTLRAFTKEPALFARLLSIHVGELSLRDFGARGVVNLGWQVLFA